MGKQTEMIVTLPGGVAVHADYQGHHIATDQPRDEGGEGSAPEPFVLFLASLGTCAGYYVLKFCQARDLPTDGIRIKQTMSRDDQGKLVAIDLGIEVPAEFPDKYHPALVRAAEQCAVKRALQDPPAVTTAIRVSGREVTEF